MDENESSTILLPVAPKAYSQTIDVTSAYTTFIRLLARLRGKKGVAAEARHVLDCMHQVRSGFENGLPDPEENSENKIISKPSWLT